MWLLNTVHLRLMHFAYPPAQYAILSHVWEANETTFQNIQASVRRLSIKIVDACKYAADDGFEWIWIDTCCIDKTNSTELSEAINSMFAWYARSTVCYAYLADVRKADNMVEHVAAFKRSRWHTRGWTLQELLAPTEVRFLSAEWEFIGNKNFLAPLLEEATGVHRDILRHGDLSSVSVAERMSWASSRQTTRLEDEAYCLMGIFNVNIPVIYGEGLSAFRRLQEAIMRTSPDQTLFLWGTPLLPSSTLCLCSDSSSRGSRGESNLLASSPACFGRQKPSSVPQVVPYTRFINALEMLVTQSRQEVLTSSSRMVSKSLLRVPVRADY